MTNALLWSCHLENLNNYNRARKKCCTVVHKIIDFLAGQVSLKAYLSDRQESSRQKTSKKWPWARTHRTEENFVGSLSILSTLWQPFFVLSSSVSFKHNDEFPVCGLSHCVLLYIVLKFNNIKETAMQNIVWHGSWKSCLVHTTYRLVSWQLAASKWEDRCNYQRNNSTWMLFSFQVC